MEKKIRVYELAKRLKMTSKELLAELDDLGVEVKNHMSTLDSHTVDMLVDIYSSVEEEENIEVKKAPKPKSKPREEKEIEIEEKTEVEENLVKEKEIEVSENITLRELCEKIGISTSKVIKDLFMEGRAFTINTVLDRRNIEEISQKYSIRVKFVLPKEEKISDPLKEEFDKFYVENKDELSPRPPVVTIMGHVDHGKTTLLDRIRRTRVAEKEVGGITQSIGAYKVKINGKSITFIDTPGHEAFTEMRARGAQATDVVVLVVAADDGVMPQTVEAYDHAKTAGVPVVVAINKIDKPNANVELTKQELVNKLNVIPDDWGGDTPVVPISAKAGIGIDELLEMILLVAELKEIKCHSTGKARGVIIESKLDKFRGPVATVVVKDGILKMGDNFVAGKTHGKVKSLLDENGKQVKLANPSDPVVVLGFEDVPDTNSLLYVVSDQKAARAYAEKYAQSSKAKTKHVRLDNILELAQSEGRKVLNLILKADTFGALGALKTSIQKIEPEEINIEIIHAGIGNVNVNDVLLASATQGIILGFSVGNEPRTKAKAEQLGVQIKIYNVIFELLDDIKAALSGMMEPEIVEEIIGHARVLQVFNISKTGKIAGFQLYDGRVEKSSRARVFRANKQIFDGTIETLKHFKSDVNSLEAPQEGGLNLEGFEDFLPADEIEFYVLKEVKKSPTYRKTD